MKPGFVTVAITTAIRRPRIPPADGRTSGRRRALAEWLASRENPLTARVIVNRIWHHHFGRGIVATLDNFGKMGEQPTHPELLDWLAVEFMDRGWSIKQMHRLIMTSEAYQMASQFDDAGDLPARSGEPLSVALPRAAARSRDRARHHPGRRAERLNLEIGGRRFSRRSRKRCWHQMSHGIWRKQADGPEVWRRSVYVYRKRGLPFPMFETFDLPDQNITCGARNVSTVPTQALTLMNDEFVLRQAELFRANASGGGADECERARSNWRYRLALARPPTRANEQTGARVSCKRTLAGFTHVLLNLNEFVYLR